MNMYTSHNSPRPFGRIIQNAALVNESAIHKECKANEKVEKGKTANNINEWHGQKRTKVLQEKIASCPARNKVPRIRSQSQTYSLALSSTAMTEEQPAINTKGWTTIYPLYFDKSKSMKDGRRIPIQYAVERPTAAAIHLCCKQLQLDCVLEVWLQMRAFWIYQC